MSSVVRNGIRLESPLVGRIEGVSTLRLGGTTIRERPFLGHINLRGVAADTSFQDCVARVVGVAPPIAPNTVLESGQRSIWWLCPSEWLILCPSGAEEALANTLREVLHSQLASVVQIGGGYTVLELQGSSARELLARGCPLDLHERVFKVGQCAQTHLAKAPVLLRPITAGIELVIRRSFADYLWQWLRGVSASGAA